MVMLNFIVTQYCYDYTVNQISLGLLLYSHIPTAIFSILFGSYVLLKEKKRLGWALFFVSLFFTVWSLLDIISWFSFLGSMNVMFAWSFLDLVALLMFLFSYYFIYVFVVKKSLPIWQWVIGVILIIPTAVWTFLGKNLTLFDANNCTAIENDFITSYPYFIEAIFVISIIIFIFYQYRKAKDFGIKKQILLAGSGISLFLIFFFSSTFLVKLFADSDASSYVYNYEIYGLFGMPVLLGFLAFIIVRYKAFDIKLIGAQALILSLVIVIGSEFFFIRTNINRLLTSLTLIITGVIGVNLIRSVKNEVAQREKLEKADASLRAANEAQSDTLRFVTHQIRGVFTSTKAGLASILEGDFDPITVPLKNMVSELFNVQQGGVESVQAFLSASQVENGNIFVTDITDFKKIISEIVSRLKPKAVAKNIGYEVEIPVDDGYLIKGDKAYLANMVSNLIDNAIIYTEKGFVKISLTKINDKILLSVKDTGCGITEEDRPKIFTKYGHGKDSRRINVNSNGIGLYLAKKIIDGHNGRIWYETEVGKGTTFFIELPLVR